MSAQSGKPAPVGRPDPGVLRILIITNRFPRPGHETDATYNGYQADALAERNEVRAIVPVPWPERLRDFRRGGAGKRSMRGGIPIWHPTFWFPPRLMESAYGKLFLRSIRGAVKEATRDFKPDAVLACWAHPDGWAAVQIAKELGVPCIIKVIGSDVLVLMRDRHRRAGVAEALHQAAGVLAVSEDLAKHVRQLGVDAARVHVVQEGSRTDMFGPGDAREAAARLGLEPVGEWTARLLFVGNLLMSKGVGVLLEACAILKQRGIEVRCHLVGKGKDEGALREQAKRLGLSDADVHFAGSCRQDGLADWYRASDMVVLPSFSEGIPNVLREAMMCGRRFIATNVGGIPEVTRAGVGWLVPPGEPGQLADKIVEVLQSGATNAAETVVLQAAMALNISWKQSAELVEGHICEAIAELKAASGGPPISPNYPD